MMKKLCELNHRREFILKVIEDLVDGGIVLRGYLGVSINDIDENTAKVLGLKTKKGAFITSVVKNEPAENAGIKEKDVIEFYNSKNNSGKNKDSFINNQEIIKLT